MEATKLPAVNHMGCQKVNNFQEGHTWKHS